MQTLSNPPITEAILDIKFELGEGYDLDKLAYIHEAVKADYPVKEVSNKWEGFVEFKPGQEPIATSGNQQNGYWFKAADGSRIFQARTDGFTFNKLRPYTTWEDFSGEAKRLWSIYKSVVGPVKINRIALRYVNAIEIPIVSDYKKYFNYIPDINEPYLIDDFLLRFVLKDQSKPFQANLVLANGPTKAQDFKKVLVLDIDAFQSVDNPEDDAMWLIFEELRVFKNNTFSNSLTEDALNLYV